MSAQPAVPSDLLDRIANGLPEELRADYYRELSHCRNLPENDEMLRILRAMQFLVVLIQQAPGEVAIERERMSEALAAGIESIQSAHQASIQYQKQLELRLSNLPEEVARGISAEAIAAKISEALRQQFQETGLPVVAKAMAVQSATLCKTSKDLAGLLTDLADSRTGVLPRVNDVLRRMNSDFHNAADHVRAQMNGLGRELYRTIAVLCLGATMIGFVAGMLYQRFIGVPSLLNDPESLAPSPKIKQEKRLQRTK